MLTKLPYDLEILLLGIYPEKTIIQKDICTPKFIATGFTITLEGHGSNNTWRTWKQSRCALREEWIKKLWYIYTREF